MGQLGLDVRVDQAGNSICSYPGQLSELPPMAIGSHTDTVPHGGRYDGALGVVAAMGCVRALQEADRQWARRLLEQRWHSTRIVSRGRAHQADKLSGFVADGPAGRLGLVTYRLEGDQCEIVSLDSLAEGRGIGTALMAAVEQAACATGCWRLWLITTNDNLPALRFYQKRGFTLVAVHRNALDLSRRLKPEIPEIGQDGIPLCDEIELERKLRE
jgi:DNA-3-methyladenine glycosylase I